MLSENYLKAIEHNRQLLIDNLEVDGIISRLRCQSFTRDDAERIQHKVTTTEKVSLLLDTLLDRDDECFELFLEILGNESEYLAESITASINSPVRRRRLSVTEYGEILIKGGVPERIGDYVDRSSIQTEILSQILSPNSQPILVHGVVGCGKSSIVSHVLYSERLFPDRYKGVCWMSIGNIQENEVMTKLVVICTKLDSITPDATYQIPDLFKDIITKKLQKNRILLILDDIWSVDIMKYFTFPVRYIVTSRQSQLFSPNHATFIEIPPRFSDYECQRFLNYDLKDRGEDVINRIISISRGNPAYLSLIKNLVKTNKDYDAIIYGPDSNNLGIDTIIKSNLDILSPEKRLCYEMLTILKDDAKVSLNLLTIYWNIKEADALKYINSFCESHLMTKEWSEQYKCNMYGIHDIYWSYLDSKYEGKKTEFQKQFINNHNTKFPNWLKFNHCDPYFLMYCGSNLKSIGDEAKLISLFTDLTFLAAKIVIAGISDLLFDYETYEPLTNSDLWKDCRGFFMRHSHRFGRTETKDVGILIRKVFTTIIQLALFEDQSSRIYDMAIKAKSLSARDDFWVWDNPEPSMKTWEASHIDIIYSMDINHYGILLTSDTGRLSLFEAQNGTCLFNYEILEKGNHFCKFIKPDTLEFMVLSVTGTVRVFNVEKLLERRAQTPVEIYEDDDHDFADEDFKNEKQEIDFKGLSQRFRHILVQEFVQRCEVIPSIQLACKKFLVTGSLAEGTLFVASSDVCAGVFSDDVLHTHISYYDNETWTLSWDFDVDCRVKKMLHIKNDADNSFFVYLLVDDGSSIRQYNNFGNELENISKENGVINDFIIVGRDIYFSVGNSIYKNNDQTALFSTISNAIINQISSRQNLMALGLTNHGVQIWDVDQKKLLYIIKGFDFVDAQFECCHNHLITIERSHVAKWCLDSVNEDRNIVKSYSRNYRSKFYMHTYSADRILWILQKYNNELEFRFYKNGEYGRHLVVVDSKVTCCYIDGYYAFIGFQASHLRIYNLFDDWSCVRIIDSVNNVRELAIFADDEQYWNIIVHYDTNKIKSLSISKLEHNDVHNSVVTTLEMLSKLKMFKIQSNNIIIGVSSNNNCALYRIEKDRGLNKFFDKSLKEGTTIIDFDVSQHGQFLCVTTTTGLLKVWEINSDRLWSDPKENRKVVRMCKFRPNINNQWNVIATVDDDGDVRLFYFHPDSGQQKVNTIIDDSPQQGIHIFSTIIWTNDGTFLIFGDNELKKWKVPLVAAPSIECKHPLTRLHTYAGGIRCIRMNDAYLSTIDQCGFFYILRKI